MSKSAKAKKKVWICLVVAHIVKPMENYKPTALAAASSCLLAEEKQISDKITECCGPNTSEAK